MRIASILKYAAAWRDAFNSLFEMHKTGANDYPTGNSVTFNSLFEMLAYKRLVKRGAEVYRAFNSLFEMHLIGRAVSAGISAVLSILYLRCAVRTPWASPLHRFFQLSILYLRCLSSSA